MKKTWLNNKLSRIIIDYKNFNTPDVKLDNLWITYMNNQSRDQSYDNLLKELRTLIKFKKR